MKNVFLSQFLMISEWKTIVFLIAYLLLAFAVYKLPKKKFSFSSKVLIATVLGLALGLAMQAVSGFAADPMKIPFVNETTLWYSLIGNGFIDFIRMLVIPLVMVSIIHVILHMDERENVRKLVKRSILTTMGMVAVAAVVGLTLGIVFQLGGSGSAASITNGEMKEVVPVVTTLRNLIPANPVEAMVNSNVVGLVIFSAFFGLAARRMQKKYPDTIQVFYELIDALHKIIISIAMTIIKGMPYAVLALLANTIAQRGLNSILEVGKFIVILYIACIILLAFTSRSSLGVLPATIDTLTQKLGVSQGTASFVSSFGTTAGMQGCAGVFPALLIVYVANTSGTPIDISLIIMSIIVITIGSIGIAGIPGTSTMAASVGLSGVGLGASFAFITPILAIDPIIDMMRTMLNVSGSLTNAIMVDRQLELMDMELYQDMTRKEAEKV